MSAYMRIWRWRLAATVVQQIESRLDPALEVLARLDEDLYSRDAKHRATVSDPNLSPLRDWGEVINDIGLSYLWVLGAYEAVRTLHQRLVDMGAPAMKRAAACAALKHKYERVRIPLAKLEPAKRFVTTDYAFARPGIDDSRGIAWEVSHGVAVSRSELSDAFLSFLEEMRTGAIKE
jgi:hypothetical protein